MLVILSLMIGTMTLIVLNSIKSSTSYSHALNSYYAAESGLEKSMYYLESARRSKKYGAAEVGNTISSLTDTLDNNASYQVTADTVSSVIETSISENKVVQLDLFTEEYSPSLKLAALDSSNPITMNFNWNESCVAGSSKIEVSFAGWSPLAWKDFTNPDDFQNKYVIECPGPGAGYDCEYNALALNPGFLYKMRVKALECDVTDIIINPKDISGTTVETNNVINIQSTGKFASTEQTMQAKAFWRVPIVDFFDYVLFSQQVIGK